MGDLFLLVGIICMGRWFWGTMTPDQQGSAVQSVRDLKNRYHNSQNK